MAITYSGDTADFVIIDGCNGKILGADCAQSYQFEPHSAGIKKLVVIASASPGGSVSYTLTGLDCGDVGESCCGGEVCQTGTCYESTCVATQACSCPDGATATTFTIQKIDTCTTSKIVVCGVDSAPIVTYGGAYQTAPDASCAVPNPRTGACSCPGHLLAIGVAVVAPGVVQSNNVEHIYLCELPHPTPSPSPM